MMKLPLAKVPAVISESAATTLRAHGLMLSPELLRELGNNTAQALLSLDLAAFAGVDEPSASDRLRVGETLRALAQTTCAANGEMAELFTRVGEWLAAGARAELGLQRRAHADTLTPAEG